MPGTPGPRLGLVWGYAPGETGWGVGGFNPNFQKLEALVHLTVVSITTTPPATPANGDCYIVGVGGTGVWAGHDSDVAVWYTTGGWLYIDPAIGVRAYNRATSTYWRYDGSVWIQEILPSADVSGPASAVDAHLVVFDGTTGKIIRDGGQELPDGFLVGTTDSQILTNKVIEGASNSLNVRLDADVSGNLPVSRLNGGTGASATTVWYGDGTWKESAGGISQLTGDVTAGPGSGSVVTTLVATAVTPGSYTSTNLTVDAKGRITAATSGTSGASITVSDAPPASPTQGQLWFDGETACLFVWFVDAGGGTGQWVVAVNSSGDGGGGSTDWANITSKPSTFPPTLPIAQSGVTNLVANLAAKAPLDSPVFTGTPALPTGATAVTQTAATNNTTPATTAYVKSQGYQTANQTITLSGDLSGSGTTAITATLATVNSNVGTFQGLTLDGKGRVTAASNQNYISTTTAASTYLPLAGGTLSGRLTISFPDDGGAQLLAAGTTNAVRMLTTATYAEVSAVTPTLSAYAPLVLNGLTVTISAPAILNNNLTVAGTIYAGPWAKPANLAANTVVGGSLTSGQLLGFNAYFDGVIWRYLSSGPAQAFMINADPGSGGWGFGITNVTGTAGNPASPVERMRLQNDGTCLNTTGTWATISDAAAKTNVAPYTKGLNAILNLDPISFRYNDRSPYGGDDQTRYGLIADHVRPHVPEAVGSYTYKPDDGKDERVLSTLDPGHLIFVLINSVKELAERVVTLEDMLTGAAR